MAKWIFYRNRRNHVVAGFFNIYTSVYERLGASSPATSEAVLLDWVVKQGGAEPGDGVVFGDGLSGRVVSFVRTRGDA